MAPSGLRVWHGMCSVYLPSRERPTRSVVHSRFGGIARQATSMWLASHQEIQEMRSTNFSWGAIRRVCGALVVSLAVWLGHSPAAEASITVRLQQVTESGSAVNSVLANSDPSEPTVVYARLLASGAGSPLPLENLFSFATVMTWFTTSDGVTASDLFPSPTNATSVTVNTSGFLFYNGGVTADFAMNSSGLQAPSERYLSVFNINDEEAHLISSWLRQLSMCRLPKSDLASRLVSVRRPFPSLLMAAALGSVFKTSKQITPNLVPAAAPSPSSLSRAPCRPVSSA